MSIFDLIKNIFNNGKKNVKLIINNLEKTYGDTTPLEVALYSNNEPVQDKNIIFKVNGIEYSRTTDENGVARLNINLNPGEYLALISFADDEYNSTNAYANIIIKSDTRIEGTDIVKTASEKAVYQCAVYDIYNKRVDGTVKLTVNGVPYLRDIGNDGLAKLNINLGKGEYILTAEYPGDSIHNPSKVTNKIIVNDDPKPEPTPTPTGCTKPYTSSPHPTNSGCNGMGQNTSTYCAPSSVHKCLYKFGIRDISQATLASWMATNSSGTSHQGIETGIAKVNQVKGTNIKIQWYNKSDLSWEEIGKILCQPNKAIFCHILYKNGGTCSGSGNYGHYELLTKVNTDTGYVKVLNSLGGYCGSCYCGFYQDRTMACQEQFMRGISQRSIAVLTKQ